MRKRLIKKLSCFVFLIFCGTLGLFSQNIKDTCFIYGIDMNDNSRGSLETSFNKEYVANREGQLMKMFQSEYNKCCNGIIIIGTDKEIQRQIYLNLHSSLKGDLSIVKGNCYLALELNCNDMDSQLTLWASMIHANGVIEKLGSVSFLKKDFSDDNKLKNSIVELVKNIEGTKYTGSDSTLNTSQSTQLTDTTKHKLLTTGTTTLFPLTKPKNGLPIGWKQIHSEYAFDKVRGYFWMVSQVGGFGAGMVNGINWCTKANDYAALQRKYKNEIDIDEKNNIQKAIAKADTDINIYRQRFWRYLCIMAGSYGFNVLDNCLWTKSNKQNTHALHIMPNITPQYNEITLTYNF